MVNSMTGFATRRSEIPGFSWKWDIRAVNGRGFDFRPRLPDWIEGLEQPLRAAAGKAVARGSVSVALKVERDTAEVETAVDPERLDRVLGALRMIEERALAADLQVAPVSAADILAMRAVRRDTPGDADTAPLRQALLDDFQTLLGDFNAMRASEGAALEAIVGMQLDRMAATLRKNLARVLQNADGTDPDRVAQELAMIAVRADVREELDRLAAHVAAARDLLGSKGPVGRRLDFLAQEFMREANTLCAKAQSGELTGIGLDLKALIEQWREQVQNIE